MCGLWFSAHGRSGYPICLSQHNLSFATVEERRLISSQGSESMVNCWRRRLNQLKYLKLLHIAPVYCGNGRCRIHFGSVSEWMHQRDDCAPRATTAQHNHRQQFLTIIVHYSVWARGKHLLLGREPGNLDWFSVRCATQILPSPAQFPPNAIYSVGITSLHIA